MTTKNVFPLVVFFLISNLLIGQQVMKDRLILKVKEEFRSACQENEIDIQSLDEAIDGKYTQLFKKFKEEKVVAKRESFVDLSLIYELRLVNGVNLEKIIQQLYNLELFEYVEPKYIRTVDYTPNDPDLSQQSYLNIIRAIQGWDTEKGNASITIAIVDTGTDLDHPDLISKLKNNTNDPVNGVDDDNDGYIDNFQGWDFTTNDNDPSVTFNDHGVTVAGAAVAEPDNNEGIAGVGFDCSYLPVKVGEHSAITEGYEGIKYAADAGVDIINCSWGGFDASNFEQDIINYATLVKGAIVIAAAGNQNRNEKYYPAAYDYVLAVASTNGDDTKASFSNYGYWVDIAAPGDNVYTTANNGAYRVANGTSLSCPQVAGAAALIKAEYPSLSGVQLGERLKEKIDNIDGANPTYVNKLGTGRLNLENSLTGGVLNPSIDLSERTIEDGNDNAFKIGDTLEISARFTNYLASSGVLTATLTTSSPYVTIVNDQYAIGVLGTLSYDDNHGSPYRVKIESNTPKNELVVFEITVTDGSYSKVFYEEIYLNVDYLNVEENRVGVTITSKGLLGYNLKDQKEGIGARLDGGETMMFEGGLMVGAIPNTIGVVVDNIRSSGALSDQNFSPVLAITPTIPTVASDFEAYTEFTDTASFSDKLTLKVKQDVKVWKDTGHDNYVVLNYKVINMNVDDQKDVFVGLFTDFDVANYEKNKFKTNTQRYLGYTISSEPNTPVAGVQLLNVESVRFYGIDNEPGGNGGVDIRNGFFSDEKYIVLSTNRYGAGGVTPQGNDVLQCVSAEIGDIPAGDSAIVSFALILADDTNQLFQAADSAYYRYNGKLPTSVSELEVTPSIRVYPNPIKEGQLTLEGLGYRSIEEINVYDVSGRTYRVNYSYSQDNVLVDVSSLSAGFYWVRGVAKKQMFGASFLKIKE